MEYFALGIEHILVAILLQCTGLTFTFRHCYQHALSA